MRLDKGRRPSTPVGNVYLPAGVGDQSLGQARRDCASWSLRCRPGDNTIGNQVSAEGVVHRHAPHVIQIADTFDAGGQDAMHKWEMVFGRLAWWTSFKTC